MEGAVQVPIDLIRPHPHQVRRELTGIEGLAETIRQVGLLEPVLLVPADDEGGGYFLEAGHRRHAACRLAGLELVPAVIAPPGTAARQVLAMLVENGEREGLSAIEEAQGLQQVMALGDPDLATPAKLAKVLGRPVKEVRDRVALAHLPETAQDAVHAGQVDLETAGALVEFADDPETLAKLMESLGTNNFGWNLSAARDHRAAVKAEADLRKKLAAAGVPVIDAPTDWRTGKARLVNRLVTPEGEALDEEEHMQCPHAAVHLGRGGARVWAVGVCLDPEAAGHRMRFAEEPQLPAGGDPGTSAAADPNAAYQAEQKRLNTEREAREERGRSLRSAFLLTLPVRKVGVELALLRLYLTRLVPEYLSHRPQAGSYMETRLPDIQELAGILGVTLPAAVQKSRGTKAQTERDLAVARETWDRFAPAIGKASLEQCLRALLSMLRRDLEYRVGHHWTDHAQVGAQYMRFLREQGYGFSDEELAVLAERSAVAAPVNPEEAPDGDD
jgi:ParB family chromosome partitioning protein